MAVDVPNDRLRGNFRVTAEAANEIKHRAMFFDTIEKLFSDVGIKGKGPGTSYLTSPCVF